MPENKYYVYIHRRMDTGTVFYVGKGCGNRIDYPYRNEEHDYIVHYLQENNIELRTERIGENLTEAEALDLECRTICKYVGEGYGLNGKHLEMPPNRPYLTNKNFGEPIGLYEYEYPAYGGKLESLHDKKIQTAKINIKKKPIHEKGTVVRTNGRISKKQLQIISDVLSRGKIESSFDNIFCKLGLSDEWTIQSNAYTDKNIKIDKVFMSLFELGSVDIKKYNGTKFSPEEATYIRLFKVNINEKSEVVTVIPNAENVAELKEALCKPDVSIEWHRPVKTKL